MRYLIVLGLLALTFAAFADNPAHDSADVTLTIPCSLAVDIVDETITLTQAADPDDKGPVEETFEEAIDVDTNCDGWSGSVEVTDLKGEQTDAELDAAASSSMPTGDGKPGADQLFDLTITVTRNGLDDPADTYKGTVTATVTCP